MEWTVDLQGGTCFVHFLYCSGERRPCRMSINGRLHPVTVLGEPTGGFMPASLAWKTYGPLELAKGENRIRIATEGYMPHLKGVYVSPDRMLDIHDRADAAVAKPLVPQFHEQVLMVQETAINAFSFHKNAGVVSDGAIDRLQPISRDPHDRQQWVVVG
jgi:hypothetical protein